MKFISTDELEAQAARLLESLGALEVPVPIDIVAHRLGLIIEEVPLGDAVSGVLVVDGSRGVIGVNSGDAVVRKRFSIAHEIAHFVLHKGESDIFIDKAYVAFRNLDSAAGEKRAEIQANQFAAALLMPKESIRREMGEGVIDLGDEEVLKELAAKFLVSSQAMAYRMSALELLRAI